MNRMVPSNLVIWHAFIFTRIFILIKTLSQHLSKRGKLHIINAIVLVLVSFLITRFESICGRISVFMFCCNICQVLNALSIFFSYYALILDQVLFLVLKVGDVILLFRFLLFIPLFVLFFSFFIVLGLRQIAALVVSILVDIFISFLAVKYVLSSIRNFSMVFSASTILSLFGRQ
jgi:hypothetical protein